MPASDTLRRLGSRITTPLLPQDYLHLPHPLWSARELRGQVVEVRPGTEHAATLVIKPGWGWRFDHQAGQYVGIARRRGAVPRRAARPGPAPRGPAAVRAAHRHHGAARAGPARRDLPRLGAAPELGLRPAGDAGRRREAVEEPRPRRRAAPGALHRRAGRCRRPGRHRHLPARGHHVQADGATTLLQAGEQAGVQLPFGCRMGICQSCVVPILAGSTRDLRSGLVKVEGDRVQTCVSAAAGDCVLDA